MHLFDQNKLRIDCLRRIEIPCAMLQRKEVHILWIPCVMGAYDPFDVGSVVQRVKK